MERISKENLNLLIDDFFVWYDNDPHKINENAFLDFQRKEFWEEISDEALLEVMGKFYSEGGLIQSGGTRFVNIFLESLKANLQKFKNLVLQVINTKSIDKTWWSEIKKFTHFSTGNISILLHRINPERFAILNNKAFEGLKRVGFSSTNRQGLNRNFDEYTIYQNDLQKFMEYSDHRLSNYYVTDSLWEYIIGQKKGSKYLPTQYSGVRYFKIAPGPSGALWDLCKDAGEIRVNFREIGDMNNIKNEEELKQEFSKTITHTNSVNQFSYELWTFKNLNVGDTILANKGVTGILGLGKVTKTYYYNEEYSEYKHCLGVEWYNTEYKQVPIPGNWAFRTLLELTEDNFNELLSGINYWIFQANPDIFDVFSALKENKVKSWLVNQNKGNIKSGDKVILWVTGEKSGCYALAEVSENPKEVGLESDDHFWKTTKPSGLRAPITITHNYIDNPILKSEIMNIEELKHLKAGKQGTNLKATKEEFELLLKLRNGNSNNHDNFPKNLILYGPPGTGKTYSTKRKAVEIILKGKIENVDIDAEFKRLKAEGRIEFVTFHQSFSYEQFVEGISVLTKDGEIVYEVRDGIFKSISNKAKNPEGNFDEKIKWLCNKLGEDELVELDSSTGKKFTVAFRGSNGFWAKPSSTNNEHYVSFNSLRKMYEYPETTLITNTTYVRGILKFLYDEGLILSKSSNEISQKNFVLIIDEINRGNISKIFGELITLFEEDKRLGEDNEIIVTLPYSGEQFGVPPNLYIIGTMNTADRSLVQLDTALRRRFDFEEMMPKYDFWSSKVGDFDLNLFLQKLNEKICELYDREHQIGHSFLMKVHNIEELRRAWENRIMPLLQEYFYADYGNLAQVIGESEYLTKPANDNEKWKLKMKASEGEGNFEKEFAKVYKFVVNGKNINQKTNVAAVVKPGDETNPPQTN